MKLAIKADMAPLEALNYLESEIEEKLSISLTQSEFSRNSGHKVAFLLALSHIRIIKSILEKNFHYNEAREKDIFKGNEDIHFKTSWRRNIEGAINAMSGQLGERLKSDKRLALELIGSNFDTALVFSLGLFATLIISYVILGQRADTLKEYNDDELDVPTEALFTYMRNESILRMSVSGTIFLLNAGIYSIKKILEFFQITKEKTKLLTDFDPKNISFAENLKGIFKNICLLQDIELGSLEEEAVYDDFSLMSDISKTSLACVEKIHRMGLDYDKANKITEWIFEKMKYIRDDTAWREETVNRISELFLVVYKDQFDKKKKKIDVSFELLSLLFEGEDKLKISIYLKNIDDELQTLVNEKEKPWRLTKCSEKSADWFAAKGISAAKGTLNCVTGSVSFLGKGFFNCTVRGARCLNTNVQDMGRVAYNSCKNSLFSNQNEVQRESNEIDEIYDLEERNSDDEISNEL